MPVPLMIGSLGSGRRLKEEDRSTVKPETSAGQGVFSVRSDSGAARVHSRGRCAAAASALGQGRRAWRPAVLPNLARGQSGAGEKERGHFRPKHQHGHR